MLRVSRRRVLTSAVGTALKQQGMVKGKKFFTLTANYIFGHDLLKAAKVFRCQ